MAEDCSNLLDLSISFRKRALAGALHFSGASWLLPKLLTPKKHIRAVNAHQTLARDAAAFERQLKYYQRHFVSAGPAELAAMLETGEWRHEKPGLIISFDDGARDNVTVAAPLLEKYGFTGWFFVPAGLVECPAAEQAAFAKDRQLLGTLLNGAAADGRVAPSWDELRTLQQKHVVGCHGYHHRRLGASLPAEQMRQEIVEAKRLMEERLGREVQSFCWIGGEEESYSAQAARMIADAGYRFGFMTASAPITAGTHRLQLHRTNVESFWPMPMVTMQLSGLCDRHFAGKRARVNELTRTG